MSPDPHHTSSMAWQKSKPTTDNANLGDIFEENNNTKRFSILSTSSDSSSSSSNIFTARSCNSAFLDRIKYFERKTDHIQTEPQEKQTTKMGLSRKLSLKKVIDDIRAQFPEDDLDIRKGTPIKRKSNESSSPRLSYNENNRLHPPITKADKQDIEAPTNKLSPTIHDVREQFTNGNSVDSKCAQFFATSNNEFLLGEMSAQKQFRTMLKGSLYNNFYPEELASQPMRYYIHDFFDYDLSPFENER